MALLQICTETLILDVDECHRYCLEAGYRSRYPEYYSWNFPEKSMEHFVAMKLLQPAREDIFLDLASEDSPVCEIWSRLYGTNAYSQDIMYEKGVHGHRIGSDACAMPLPDGFASKALLACSLEHFEGDADARLFTELHRVLQPGGKLCVVPFYLASVAFTMTDPTISAINDVSFDQGALLYCSKGWGNRHGRHYSPETFAARIAAHTREMFDFKLYHLSNAKDIDSSCYGRFALLALRKY